MRRGVPCWYKRPDVGLDGVYDATLIQSAMYTTLKKHLGAKPYYKHVLETFNVTDKPELSQFTMEKYEAITKYKTSYYTFQLPVSAALLMAAVTGKNGTDIQDGKCTWLAVVALQRANSAQKQLMELHYGRNDPESVAKIKDLYEELQLPHTYSVFEEATYDLIRTQIQQVTRGLPHDLFFKILDNIFRRSI
ncbi:Farnesyl pyrophosphate syntase [Operophtera brumata]|uniref:Farnesyl pyrophosphate syntase n=1 Tax=Operophtera brumata TaxID=104452 RepID=A0A0L7KIS0_OPEBR|nr:Farnesyl pyrophosphate syntase [Operophtera brumata]